MNGQIIFYIFYLGQDFLEENDEKNCINFGKGYWYYYCGNAFIFGTGFSGGEKLTLGKNPILSYGGPEMDIFDIGFFYGIFAMLIVTYYLLKPVIMNKYHRNNIVNVKFSYLLFLVVMFLGGHVLSSPMAGIFFTVAYVANKYYD